MDRGSDPDESRAAVTARGHLGTVSDWMTPTVAARLEFHELVPYKNLLKKYFSRAPWTEEDAGRLSELVRPAVDADWWDEIALEEGLVVGHGVRDDLYLIEVRGDAEAGGSLWDRVFSGPVIPEPTPHPRKVRFVIGGDPAPGRWYRRGDEVDDERVRRIFAEDDVTDVMVAGDFVTVGLDRGSPWEDRLDPILDLVATLFPVGAISTAGRTRDELVAEGRELPVASPDELHLLDPDDHAGRGRLQQALADGDARVRRIAVAVLAESSDQATAHGALRRGCGDRARVVRRTAVDAAADRGEEALRDLLEAALTTDDAWLRWRAVRALGELGLGRSRSAVAGLVDDADFQVRFEVARVLRAAPDR
jgi:hypothetical protein